MRTKILILSLAGLGALDACAKPDPACDAMTVRLCEANAAHCEHARGWIDKQGAGDAPARDAACAEILADPRALMAYVERFGLAMAPKPRVAPVAPRPAATTSPAAPKPTSKDDIRTFGDNVEEIGTVGKKVGDALDKIEDAFNRKPDARP